MNLNELLEAREHECPLLTNYNDCIATLQLCDYKTKEMCPIYVDAIRTLYLEENK